MSFAVTAKLICVFVFAYAKSRFSHDAAQLILGDGLIAREKSGFLFGKPKTQKPPKRGGSGKAELAEAAIGAASELLGGNHATGGPRLPRFCI